MRAVLFDLDGTLADTDADIRAAWKAALADLNLACPRFDELFVAGPPLDEMIRRLFPTEATPALVEEIRRLFATHYDADGFPNTREYPGVLDIVRDLKARGDVTAIVTNKRFLGARAMMRHFRWNDCFDHLYAGDMFEATKGRLPKSELLGLVLDDLHLQRESCVLVGDTASDFKAAQANGLPSIAVSWGYGTAAELALAPCVVANAAELRNALHLSTKGDAP